MMACIVINVPAHSYVHCQHMSSVSLPLVTITDSAKLSPTTTTPFLSTPMILLRAARSVTEPPLEIFTTTSSNVIIQSALPLVTVEICKPFL